MSAAILPPPADPEASGSVKNAGKKATADIFSAGLEKFAMKQKKNMSRPPHCAI